VGHDGGADDADGDVEHAGLAKAGAEESAAEFEKVGAGLREDEDFQAVAGGDGGDEDEDDGFDHADVEMLEGEEKEDVEASNDDGPQHRDVEHEVEGDGAAEDFGEVAGADGDFAGDPVGPAHPGGEPVAAGLGEVLFDNDAEAGGDDLHENGHEAGEADDPEETVFELSAALQIGAPVAGIHVADADEEGGAEKGAPLTPEASLGTRSGDAAVHAFEGKRPRGRGGAIAAGLHGWRGQLRHSMFIAHATGGVK